MHYPHRAPSGPWEHLSPGQPCSPRLHGSPAHRARPACMAALLTLPQREKKPTGRVLGYSAESALLLVVRAIPSAPSLFTTVVATVLERMQFAHSLLSFCTSFSQFSRCGLATPSHRDGSCAGSPVCRQPVLRTLCLTNGGVVGQPASVGFGAAPLTRENQAVVPPPLPPAGLSIPSFFVLDAY
jgi:hypothetical protein